MAKALSRLYLSIAAIVLSALVVFNAFPFLGTVIKLPDIAPQANDSSVIAWIHTITAISIRLTIVAPLIFLAAFFNHRYNLLYAAREQYVFKKTVASALPGFKEQAAPQDADAHVKAMTAAAFERLLFNPREAATRDLTITVRGGRLSRWLVKLIQQAFEDAKGTKGPPA